MPQHQETAETFADRFALLLEEKCISLRELSRLTESDKGRIAVSTLHKYKKGEAMPGTGWRTRKLAEIFGVTPVYLLRGGPRRPSRDRPE